MEKEVKMLNQIRHIGFKVKDLHESIHVWQKLGLTLFAMKTEQWGDATLKIAKLQDEHYNVLELIETEADWPDVHISFDVESVYAVASTLKQGVFNQNPEETAFYIKGPDGIILEMVKEEKKPNGSENGGS